MVHTLLYNAKIYTLAREKPCDWILFAGGTIIACGDAHNRPSSGSFTIEKTDLKQACVLPAFGDSHLHIIPTALRLQQINLEPCRSPEEVVTLLKKHFPAQTETWVLGAGFNPNLWKDSQPHRSMLDTAFPATPVALASKDLHTLWVNSLALQEAGIDSRTPDPENGRIVRDTDGTPTGLLHEMACETIYQRFTNVSPAELEELMDIFTGHFHKLGITSVNAIEELNTWKQLQQLHRKHKLRIRITCHLPQIHLEQLIEAGLVSGFGDEWLRLGGIKFFTDGSLGSQTADLFESYQTNPGYTGISTITEETLTERVAKAASSGLSSTIHAIGNRAVNKTLNAFEKALPWQQQFKLIQRMEHAQLINPEDLPRFSAYGIVASMQPSHIADDVEVAKLHWGDLSRYAYPIRELLDQNTVVSFGSDSPVADPNPFRNIFSAVERKYLLDSGNKSWYPEHSISMLEAVKAHTVGVAAASGSETYLGTLAPGKRADIIVLDRNIFEIPMKEILHTRVLTTFLNGSVVYSER